MKPFFFLLSLLLTFSLHAQQSLIPGSRVFISTYVPEAGTVYDPVGRQHNEAIERLGNATRWYRLSAEEIKTQIYTQVGSAIPKTDFDRLYTLNQQHYTNYKLAVKNGTEATFWQGIGADPQTIAFVQRLKAMIKASEVSPNDSVVRAVRILQREIAASSIAAEKKEALMYGCTVSCYSLDYWSQKFEDPAFLAQVDPVAVKNEYGLVLDQPLPIRNLKGSGGPDAPLYIESVIVKKSNSRLIAEVATSDLAGAVFGAITGFLGGPVGGAGGAIIGAAASSTTAAVAILVTTPMK